MKTELEKDELNLIALAQNYSDEGKARELLESLRWPNGPICPHCKNDGKAKAICRITPKPTGKRPVRNGLYFCGVCRKQFPVTVGTVFEASHIRITTWMMAM